MGAWMGDALRMWIKEKREEQGPRMCDSPPLAALQTLKCLAGA